MRLFKRLHYGWILVAGSVLILATHSLTFFTFGIFLSPVTEEFGWDRGEFSVAISLTTLISGLTGVITGRLSDRHGPRLLVAVSGILSGIGFLLMTQIDSLWQVYLLYGLLISIGISGRVVPITSTVPRWFVSKRGIAMGLTWTGMAVGGMVGPVLTEALISSNGWRSAYIAIGLINIILVPILARLLRRDPAEIGMKPYGETQISQGKIAAVKLGESLPFNQVIRTRRFWYFGLLLCCMFFVHQVMLGHLAPYAIDINLSSAVAALLISIMSAANLVGRNLAGFMADRIGARRYLSICLGIITLSLAWLLFTRAPWTMYVFVLAYGLVQGSIPISQTLVVTELFGLQSLGTIMASVRVMGLIGGSLGAPTAGIIYDANGSYTIAFIICLVLGATAFALSLLLIRTGTGKPGSFKNRLNTVSS